MKKKISQFEFAIMNHIEPEKSVNYEPITNSEEKELRRDKLMNQSKNLKVKK